MTDEAMTDEEWQADGWTADRRSPFNSIYGPVWQRVSGGSPEYSMVAENRHSNMNGVIHGGLLLTFADEILGMASQIITKTRFLATAQIQCQMLDAVAVGERLLSSPRVIRDTKMLIFAHADIFANERLVVSADAVFKKTKPL